MKLTHLAAAFVLLAVLLPLGSAPAQNLPAHALPDAPSFTPRSPSHLDGAFQGENNVVHNSPNSTPKTARSIGWEFIAAHSVYGGLLAFDMFLTEEGVSHGCEEANGALGPYPSTGRIVGYSLAEFGAVTALDYALVRLGQHLGAPRWMQDTTGILGASIGTFKHARGGMAWMRTNCL